MHFYSHYIHYRLATRTAMVDSNDANNGSNNNTFSCNAAATNMNMTMRKQRRPRRQLHTERSVALVLLVLFSATCTLWTDQKRFPWPRIAMVQQPQQAQEDREDGVFTATVTVWNHDTVSALQQHLATASATSRHQEVVPIRLMGAAKTNASLHLNTGRLVVNVADGILMPALYGEGQGHLVDLLASMTLKTNLDHWYFPADGSNSASSTTGSTAGSNITKIQNGTSRFFLEHPPLLNLTMDCDWQNEKTGAGQGNWIMSMYLARMAAALAQVDFKLQCIPTNATAGKTPLPIHRRLLTPWITGYQPALPPQLLEQWPFDHSGRPPSHHQVVIPNGSYQNMPVHKMANAIITDMRRMAMTVADSIDSDHYHDDSIRSVDLIMALFQQQKLHNQHHSRLYDDVAIHLRCGDIMGKVSRTDYGFIKFSEYAKWIRNDTTTKSIGIITQPFHKNLLRQLDQDHVDQCRNVTYTLVKYLQTAYPQARVSIHNGPNETMPHAFARLTLAKKSFVSYSTFGIFPVLASFGDGYFQKGHPNVNYWANHLVSSPQQREYYPHLHMVESPKLTPADIMAMNFTNVLEWFVID